MTVYGKVLEAYRKFVILLSESDLWSRHIAQIPRYFYLTITHALLYKHLFHVQCEFSFVLSNRNEICLKNEKPLTLVLRVSSLVYFGHVLFYR